MKYELTCIVCPRGCLIQLIKENEEYICSGNQCKRGEVYAIQEVTEPRRMITTTIKIEGSKLKRLPVVSRSAIKKEMVFEMINELEKIVVNAPVSVNDVIVSNILGSGIDIIASRSIKKDA